MRLIALIPLLVVAAACGAEEEKQAAAKAARPDAGQWELVSEVTAFRQADQGKAAIDTPVGTRTTETVCVGAAGTRAPAALFSGEGYDCRVGEYYLRNGRINVTLSCTRDGLSGGIMMTAEGNYEAQSLEYRRNIRSSLATDGDVQIGQRVTGRRTGECAPDAEGDNQSGNRSS